MWSSSSSSSGIEHSQPDSMLNHATHYLPQPATTQVNAGHKRKLGPPLTASDLEDFDAKAAFDNQHKEYEETEQEPWKGRRFQVRC